MCVCVCARTYVCVFTFDISPPYEFMNNYELLMMELFIPMTGERCLYIYCMYNLSFHRMQDEFSVLCFVLRSQGGSHSTLRMRAVLLCMLALRQLLAETRLSHSAPSHPCQEKTTLPNTSCTARPIGSSIKSLVTLNNQNSCKAIFISIIIVLPMFQVTINGLLLESIFLFLNI